METVFLLHPFSRRWPFDETTVQDEFQTACKVAFSSMAALTEVVSHTETPEPPWLDCCGI
jgi:hypothetical protein